MKVTTNLDRYRGRRVSVALYSVRLSSVVNRPESSGQSSVRVSREIVNRTPGVLVDPRIDEDDWLDCFDCRDEESFKRLEEYVDKWRNDDESVVERAKESFGEGICGDFAETVEATIAFYEVEAFQAKKVRFIQILFEDEPGLYLTSSEKEELFDAEKVADGLALADEGEIKEFFSDEANDGFVKGVALLRLCGYDPRKFAARRAIVYDAAATIAAALGRVESEYR